MKSVKTLSIDGFTIYVFLVDAPFDGLVFKADFNGVEYLRDSLAELTFALKNAVSEGQKYKSALCFSSFSANGILPTYYTQSINADRQLPFYENGRFCMGDSPANRRNIEAIQRVITVMLQYRANDINNLNDLLALGVYFDAIAGTGAFKAIETGL